MDAIRTGGLAAAPAVAASRREVGIIASSAGNAIAVPSPLRNVRRGMCQLLLIMSSAIVGCALAHHDPDGVLKHTLHIQFCAGAVATLSPRRIWKGTLLTTSMIRLENFKSFFSIPATIWS